MRQEIRDQKANRELDWSPLANLSTLQIILVKIILVCGNVMLGFFFQLHKDKSRATAKL